MRYSVVIEPVEDKKHFPGCYYAHVPTLGLTTHGESVDGALQAAKEMIEVWVETKREFGEPVPQDSESILATVDIE
ncbi:MAG: type II toxin-antitoxin system HicB family antitoxin [Verrucomicrobiota bacterium]